MEKLLRQIEADEASISLSRSGSSRSLSTLRGLGTASGKAIMIVGETVIRGAETIIIRSKLRKINALLREKNDDFVPYEVYEDLLELQRVGLYSRSIRFAAWDLLLLLMERKRTQRIVELISEWPPVETQLLLRQLAVFKLSGWTMHPARIAPVPAFKGDIALKDKNEALLLSFRNILSGMLKKDPTLLHEIFNIDEFILLHTKSFADDSDNSLPPLARFFDSLSVDYCLSRLRRCQPWAAGYETSPSAQWTLPLYASDFIDFLETGHPDFIQQVVDYIMDTLGAMSSDTDPSADSLLDVRFQAYSQSTVHPALPFIWFGSFLMLRIERTTAMFTKRDILNVLEAIWFDRLVTLNQEIFPKRESGHYTSVPAAPYSDASKSFQLTDLLEVACVMLGVLSARKAVPSLPKYLMETKTRWFLEVLPHFVANYRHIGSVRSPICGDIDDERGEMYEELFKLILSDTFGNDVKQQGWTCLLNEVHAHFLFATDALWNLDRPKIVRVLKELAHLRLIARLPPDNLPSPSMVCCCSWAQIADSVFSRDPTLLHDSIDARFMALVKTNNTCTSEPLKIDFNQSEELTPESAFSPFFGMVWSTLRVREVTFRAHLANLSPLKL